MFKQSKSKRMRIPLPKQTEQIFKNKKSYKRNKKIIEE